MRVWFVAYASEHETYNDAEPGELGYEYEVIDPKVDDLIFISSQLFATHGQAVDERNRQFLSKYEQERQSYEDRLARYNKRKDALELLSLTGFSPEDLFPYGIGEPPTFSYPTPQRIGYMEVEEI